MRVAIVAESPITRAVSLGLGFDSRYAAVLDLLAHDHDVAVVYLEQNPAAFAPHVAETAERAEVHEIQIPVMPRTRVARLAQTARLALGRLTLAAWERQLVEVLTAWDADVVVACAPVCRYAFRSLPSHFPTVTFVEEDQSIHPEGQRSTPWGRALVDMEEHVECRPLRKSACVAVIADHELAWAKARFAPAPTVVVPHSIDLRYWTEPLSSQPDLGPRAVLVTGRLIDLRNAEGLRAVIDARRDHPEPNAPELVVASSSGLHPTLEAVADQFRFLGTVDDLRPYYRAAVATLVPSFIVSGAKTTVLQGWATRCPVVTTSAAAETMDTEGGALLAGPTAEAIAHALCVVADDPDLRASLVRRGEQVLTDRYSHDALRRSLQGALQLATPSAHAHG